MVKIDPTPHACDCLSPFRSVFENRSLALVVELINAHGLDFMLGVDAKLFFNEVLHRKTVAIPPKTPLHLFSFHGLVAWDNIFYGRRNKMTKVWQTSCKRRAVKKHKFLSLVALLNRLFKSLVLLPKFQDFFFLLGKICFRINRLIHDFASQ